MDPTVGVRRILNGLADGAADYPTLPGALVKELTTTARYRDNFYTVPSGTTYVVMNLAKKPFDDLNVRRAANFVMDKNAIRLVGGGPTTGAIATHFIGPEFKGKGFEAAGGFAYDPFRTKNLAGSVARAKAEMRKAGYADGLYDGPRDHGDRRERAPEPAAGPDRRGQPREDRDQGRHQARLDRRDVHEVLRRAEEPARALPEHRLVPGLQGSRLHARPDVQRRQHPADEQREHVAARRPRDQRGHGPGQADQEPAGALRGLGAGSTS